MAYVSYWDDWGSRWLENLESLSTKPDRIMLLSDEKKDVPSWVENIAIGRRHMSQYVNIGAQLAETEWVCWQGLDDLYLDNAFLPFDESGDVYSYPLLLAGMMQGIFQYSGGYEQMYNLGHNPMLGGFFHRRSLVLEIPYRRYGWLDQIQFIEMSWFGKKVVFSDVPRGIFYRHANAHSIAGNPLFEEEAQQFREKITSGQIEKGVPELDRI